MFEAIQNPYLVPVDGPSIVSVEAAPAGFGALDPILGMEIGGAVFEPREDLHAEFRTQQIEVAVFESIDVEVSVKGTKTVTAIDGVHC